MVVAPEGLRLPIRCSLARRAQALLDGDVAQGDVDGLAVTTVTLGDEAHWLPRRALESCPVARSK
jgi:hypothetical protein